MKKFELFMGCLGNGVTVCNKAVMEHGDYKTIAHIAECGKITWYVEPSSIPGDALLRIEHNADTMRANWEKWLNDMPTMKRYETLLDKVPHIAFMHVIQNKEMDIEEKIAYMKNVCYEQSRF